MAGKRILFADADSQAWAEFCGLLGPQWQVVRVCSGMAALGEMQQQPCEVVVASIDFPELDGATLLDHIRVAHPETIRFITAPAGMKERVIGQMVGGQQFLAKPFDPATLQSTIERSVLADHLIVNSNMRELVGRIRTLPTIPSLYLEVISALNNPNATTADIGAIVAKDMAMTTKMLQVLNSAYFSLPHAITDPAEAVGILGFETVKSLIMSVKLMSQYDKFKPVYFSIDSIWKHSTNVAWIAKQFALLEVGDPGLAASAYTAGLIHDVGKVILAANFDHQYSGALAVARKQHQPLWEVEKDIFGATHGEIGAYLFGLWGMPAEIIEAAAFHHEPSRAAKKEFSPLTAVHVANVLEYEGNAGAQGLVLPVFDVDYLNELGLADRLEMWREAVGAPTSAAGRPQQRAAAPSAPALAAKAEADVAQDAYAVGVRGWNWMNLVYGGAGMVAVLCLLCWLGFMRERSVNYAEVEPPVSIPPLAPQSQPLPVSAKILPPMKPAAALPPAAEPPPAAEIASVPAGAVHPSMPDPDFDHLKLQGIFFSARNPSAIINGRLTRVNEVVDAYRICEIGPSSVTVEFESQRKTLYFR